MNPRRLIGAAILMAGVLALCVGLNAGNSMADQMRHAVVGRYSEPIIAWYILGGLVATLVGLAMMLAGISRKRST